MISQQIISQPEASINLVKVQRDLGLIKSMQKLSISRKWRIVVSGGYGLDILLGQVTRQHGDVDLILYGNVPRNEAVKQITEFLNLSLSNPQINIQEDMFYSDIDVNSPGLGANLYFVETAGNPFSKIHKVKKLDGDIVTNSENRFPSPVQGKLGEIEIEVQNPNLHLADILYKRRKQENRPAHDQDIKNLESLTDKAQVETILGMM